VRLTFSIWADSAGADLSGTRYTHPFHPPSATEPRPTVFPSSHVTDQSGTGLVHSAPAHGHDDYIAFTKAGLLPKQLRCPVDDEGCFTAEVVDWAGGEEARDLVSKSVLGNGVDAMVTLLRRQNALLAEETIEHRYPHDWKTKEPILVR
jgi:isoleucyl-tRNA synthetase